MILLFLRIISYHQTVKNDHKLETWIWIGIVILNLFISVLLCIIIFILTKKNGGQDTTVKEDTTVKVGGDGDQGAQVPVDGQVEDQQGHDQEAAGNAQNFREWPKFFRM